MFVLIWLRHYETEKELFFFFRRKKNVGMNPNRKTMGAFESLDLVRNILIHLRVALPLSLSLSLSHTHTHSHTHAHTHPLSLPPFIHPFCWEIFLSNTLFSCSDWDWMLTDWPAHLLACLLICSVSASL